MNSLKILLVEPFFSGSHRAWAESWKKYSQHQIYILSLPGRHWKWRMHGGAVTLAAEFLQLDFSPDVIIATDMLDLSVFLSLTRRKTAGVPTAIYFHENQINYPWSPTDEDVNLQRDRHYGFINYTSALSADKIFFNSLYHQNAFLKAIPEFLSAFPDHQDVINAESIRNKSKVLFLGMDFESIDECIDVQVERDPRLILWNHRWEYDKDPDTFYELVKTLKEKGTDFRLAVVGESYGEQPNAFKKMQELAGDPMVHFGYMKNRKAYCQLLRQSAILPVTSRQDFFGASVVEAIYSGVFPILPYRLAFPSHVPEKLGTQVFWNSFEELVEKVERHLESPDNDCIESLRSNILPYDWRNIISTYDGQMTDLRRNF